MSGRKDSTQPAGIPKIDLPHPGTAALGSNTARLRAVGSPRQTQPTVSPLAHAGDRVLLLQGPYGPFFRHLARHLSRLGATVRKINFNGGDHFFYRGVGTDDYQGEANGFGAFLREYLTTHRINRVFLFADCRSYHQQAIRICHERGIPVRIFEEGYLRPDFITCELDGINGYSTLPRDPSFYLSQPDEPVPEPRGTQSSFLLHWWYVEFYMLAAAFLRHRYPHYRHHNRIHTWGDILGFHATWLVSGFRKLVYRLRDRALTRRLAGELSRRYYLAPLQVFDDSQVVHHSNYRDIESFIRDTAASFARHAPEGTLLVFKHHPMDRGYRHYGAFIRQLAEETGLGDRLVYTHDIHLPTALDHALGLVTINSTVGLSALWHGTPVKVMGNAVYDMQGLTFQGPIDAFWHGATPPSRHLHDSFRNYLIRHCQLNESFYSRKPLANTAARELPGTYGQQAPRR